MIYIEEGRSQKLSGYTSLFISFGYDEKTLSWIHQNIEIQRFDKKTKKWEFLVTDFSQLLEYFSHIDDVTIKLFDEQVSENKVVPKMIYKLPPYTHQLDAIRFGLNHPKFILMDDMGLGKTAEAIHIAEELKFQKGIRHCLIVCGINTLKGNWKKEIALHSNETFRVIGEKINHNGMVSYTAISDRTQEILGSIDEFFIIVNIETLRSNEFVNALKENVNEIGMIVIDEVHKCSNTQSIQGGNMLKITAPYEIAMTGTLLTNTPVNAYFSLKWLGIDHSNLSTFKNEYCKFGGFGGHEIIGYQNIPILKEELSRCSLRRTKEEVLKDLPPKTIIKEIVTMSLEHKKFYEDVKNGVKKECDKIKLNTSNLLALVTRLRQATACPSILTSQDISSSKLERAINLTEDLISHGEKVVIFSTFKESCLILGKMLKEYNPLICTGDTKDDIINKNIDKFQNNEKYKLLIGTHQKMGTGVTLNSASYMIFIDTPFTASAFQQACDRIYRIGTKRPVFVYNLICENTIDERVAHIVDSKEAMSNYIIDNKVDEKSLAILRDYILDL